MATAHLSRCSPCTEFATRTTRLDAVVAEALAIPTPPELARKILQSTLYRARQRRRVFAMAASFALASTVPGFLFLERDDPMALAGIDFVIEEEANAILAARQPDSAALDRAVQDLRIQLPSQLGELRYVGTCPFRGTIAHHLIARTLLGKVTLLLLPDRRVDEPKEAHARGLCAIVRSAGAGSIAVIGESKRGLERVCQLIMRV